MRQGGLSTTLGALAGAVVMGGLTSRVELDPPNALSRPTCSLPLLA